MSLVRFLTGFEFAVSLRLARLCLAVRVVPTGRVPTGGMTTLFAAHKATFCYVAPVMNFGFRVYREQQHRVKLDQSLQNRPLLKDPAPLLKVLKYKVLMNRSSRVKMQINPPKKIARKAFMVFSGSTQSR